MAMQITVVGLGQVGASVGLALASRKDQVHRVGVDREPGVVQRAQKMGAFDHTFHNLNQAIKNANVVVLAVPVDEVKETIGYVANDLRSGAVVVNMTPVCQAVAEYAAKTLPAERHFVSITPSINPAYLDDRSVGVESAHADLFKKAVMLITAPPGAHADALRLAGDLVDILGGTPLFADPAEVDGLMAATQLLPELLAVALLKATVDQPGWREAQKIAGRSYADVTAPVLDLSDGRKLGQAELLNRENVLRMLAELIQSLEELHTLIDKQDADGLSKLMQRMLEVRALWAKARLEANWETASRDDVPRGSMLSQMFGFHIKPKGS
jgi:prephenate dehydrogenase